MLEQQGTEVKLQYIGSVPSSTWDGVGIRIKNLFEVFVLNRKSV